MCDETDAWMPLVSRLNSRISTGTSPGRSIIASTAPPPATAAAAQPEGGKRLLWPCHSSQTREAPEAGLYPVYCSGLSTRSMYCPGSSASARSAVHDEVKSQEGAAAPSCATSTRSMTPSACSSLHCASRRSSSSLHISTPQSRSAQLP
jgi:hypothetical protein